MNPKAVLIVDDNAVDRKVLSMKLSQGGYRVLQAEDGGEAINIARREKPDLIVLDIAFPPDVAHGGGIPWDGFLILSWLRRLDEAKHVPVVFISGGDPVKYRKRALEAGAKAFFHKPFAPEELFAVVRQALESQPSPPPAKKRILFVDDEGDWRLIAGTCLEEAGFEVVTAKDAAEALRRMETVKLDGIVLDLNLAGENGLLLMELLKQKHPGVPILIYTGMDNDSAAIQTMLGQGARQYLRKGSMAELCQTLKTMVN
ncbi:MAG TPA: response regulator [Candidatus Binatia bacterium]|jgi:two-component system chemotaxis response regulator CheY|nr:response regulator [Candidatus Binatia bacterium]